MKKFVIVMLVLGMATTANAVLSLTVNGQAAPDNLTLAMSDTIELDVEAAVGFIGGTFAIQLSNSQGVLDASGVQFAPQYCQTYISSIPYSVMADWDMPLRLTPSAPPEPHLVTIDGGNFSNAIQLDQMIAWDIIFHCEEHTPVTIELFAVTVNTDSGMIEGVVLDSIAVTQIPEPATIALLGLGGLLLRRRK